MMNDLVNDSRLADDIHAQLEGATSGAKGALLTGVTGFVGGEIAATLLQRTDLTLHCLVRDGRNGSAQARLDEVCRRRKLDRSRVALVRGALPGADFPPALVNEIDAVIHCAAAVNLFAPYAQLRPVNVLGTLALLRFAARGARKDIHFVSTTGVFLSPRYRSGVAREEEPVACSDHLRNGYAASKWVADTMMTRARARGFSVTIHRPAFVGWHSLTGRHGEHDLVALLLLASAAAGCAPQLDLQVNSAPVDYVANSIVDVLLLPAARGGTYHLANKTAVRFVDLARQVVPSVVEMHAWCDAVARRAPQFATFAKMVRVATEDPRSGSDELHFEYDRKYLNDGLRHALGPRYTEPPALEGELLEVFLQRVGIHSRPRASAAA